MITRLIKIFFTFSLFFLISSHSASAGTCTCYEEDGTASSYSTDSSISCTSSNSNCTYSGSTTGDTTSSGSSGTVKLEDPLGLSSTTNAPQTLIGKVIAAALGLVGSLALVMFIYGGFMWMTAMGNSEKVKKGRDTMIWAALGLLVIFTAYGLVQFVLVNVLVVK